MFYEYVHDFADCQTCELIIDQAWAFEQILHKGAVESVETESTDVSDGIKIESTHGILNEIWHDINDFKAASYINENVNDNILKAWIFHHIRRERGPSYHLQKKLHLKIVQPLMPVWNKMKSFEKMYHCFMVTKALLYGLFLSILCFMDVMKDIILASMIWFYSETILVRESI